MWKQILFQQNLKKYPFSSFKFFLQIIFIANTIKVIIFFKCTPELESRPKSSRPRRDIDVARPRRDQDFEQKLETRPRLERSETETIHETFETKRLQYFANTFDTKFWTFGELPNTLQYRFLGISLLYLEQANPKTYTT